MSQPQLIIKLHQSNFLPTPGQRIVDAYCDEADMSAVRDLIQKLNSIQESEKYILELERHIHDLNQEIHDLKGKITAHQLREQLAKREKEKFLPWYYTPATCSRCGTIISTNGKMYKCDCKTWDKE